MSNLCDPDGVLALDLEEALDVGVFVHVVEAGLGASVKIPIKIYMFNVAINFCVGPCLTL